MKDYKLFTEFYLSCKIIILTVIICCILYPMIIFIFAQLANSNTAEGSLLLDKQGNVIGSTLIAQSFTQPKYFWSRPSATDYNAAASGGSNLSPTNPQLRYQAELRIAKLGFQDKLIPVDMITASGSGLDPHISLPAAKIQANRVAEARGLSVETVNSIIEKTKIKQKSISTSNDIINVLLINLALDEFENNNEQ
jgi:potassium-transporting ATPase KdpC subunit